MKYQKNIRKYRGWSETEWRTMEKVVMVVANKKWFRGCGICNWMRLMEWIFINKGKLIWKLKYIIRSIYGSNFKRGEVDQKVEIKVF